MNINSIKSLKKASPFEEAFFTATNTYIHPTAIIGNEVVLEDNVKIGPFSVIIGKVHIGAGTRIHAHVVIGYPAQVLGLKESFGTISIGKNCEIREFVTIHAARTPTGKTSLGDNCYVMNYSHISHDCTIENNVTMVNNVSLGGHTYVEKHAFLMANAATHQFCRIGQLTALAPYSGTRQDLPPFCLFTGQPGAFAGLNLIALKRAGLTQETINALKHVSKLFYQDKLSFELIKEQANNEPTWGNNSNVVTFMNFIEQSARGVSRKTLLNASEEIL